MLTEKHIDVLRHTLGADGRQPGYRNHYCAGKDRDPLCEDLVRFGLMEHCGDRGELGGHFYRASPTGIAAVLRPKDIKRMERGR